MLHRRRWILVVVLASLLSSWKCGAAAFMAMPTRSRACLCDTWKYRGSSQVHTPSVRIISGSTARMAATILRCASLAAPHCR